MGKGLQLGLGTRARTRVIGLRVARVRGRIRGKR